MPHPPSARVLHRTVPTGTRRETSRGETRAALSRSLGVPLLDVIYLLATLALFALVGLIAKGAEQLAPTTRGSAQHEAMGGEER